MPPEIDLADPAVLHDPFPAYDRAREAGPVARLLVPGFPMWAVTRHAEARAVLTDPRFALGPDSYALRPDVPERCRPYLRSMGELEGPQHTRLRRLVAPAFTARRAAAARPWIGRIVHALLDDLEHEAASGPVDLVTTVARPLPIEVICELVGVPAADRPRWREFGSVIATGNGAAFAEAVPGIVDGALEAVAARRAEPGDDLISELVRVQAEDGDRLSDTELVSLVWQLVLGGQTPANLVANAVEALLAHPAQLAALRADPALAPGAVEELMRWCGPQLLTIPRFPAEDVEVGGTRIPAGEPVTVAIAAANRDPRVFAGPDVLDLRRPAGPPGHLGFAHGAHFCLGAGIARAQTQVALTALLQRFPELALAGGARRAPDGGTWRLAELPVTL
ncbi:cytochrome P450 family protein [Pseudonocardia kunmingensis]|uniref:Cytochrome P450 n=1 Tax=Pseudonocardia kunmingensis TaxID=630975 RepID=A0A543DJD1_9PSEU|nr:cytochrome P450 [Pseudonocardia kunmingensis]TQM09431.1 cytochrome P450 [Pseudonocardia kunmingensis]